jgi:hypothetical protein
VKTFITVLFLLIAGNAFTQPVQVEIKRLNDYYYAGKNTELKSGVNYFVITNRKQFEKLFGNISRTDTPDFSKELMLVMLMPSSRKESKLYFKSISVKAGNFIEVNCAFDMNIQPLTYYSNPIAACTIPRNKSIQKVNFYEEKKAKYSDEIKLRPLTTLEVK